MIAAYIGHITVEAFTNLSDQEKYEFVDQHGNKEAQLKDSTLDFRLYSLHNHYVEIIKDVKSGSLLSIEVSGKEGEGEE